jgi:hypothetical protein
MYLADIDHMGDAIDLELQNGHAGPAGVLLVEIAVSDRLLHATSSGLIIQSIRKKATDAVRRR